MNEKTDKLFRILKAPNGFELALASLDDHEYDEFIEAYAKSLLERVNEIKDYEWDEDRILITLKTGLDTPQEHYYPWNDGEIKEAQPYYPAFRIEIEDDYKFSCGIAYFRDRQEYYYPILTKVDKTTLLTSTEHVAKKIKFFLEHEEIKLK